MQGGVVNIVKISTKGMVEINLLIWLQGVSSLIGSTVKAAKLNYDMMLALK